MRVLLFIVTLGILFTACKKDKYTTAPQIKYKALTTNVYNNSTTAVSPGIIFTITDAEGDLGDTATIHIKNLLTGDSLEHPFTKLGVSGKADFKAEVTASIGRLGGCQSANPTDSIDVMFYELFVVDFAKNKSNTIVTTDPVYQLCR